MDKREGASPAGAPVGAAGGGTGGSDTASGLPDPDRMEERAGEAADFLKALGHRGRLLILCHLSGGERSVGELEAALGAPQAAVSQQLARLRHEGLVTARREGRTIRYGLADGRVRRLIGLLHEMFCAPG